MKNRTRLDDWEARLGALIEARSDDCFEWGRNDCALFGADVILAITGDDPGAPFRGAYADAEGAARALREIGAGTITRTFDLFLPRRALGFARRGDLVMYKNAIGVLIGSEALFIGEEGGESGLVRISHADCARAWAI